MSLLIIRFIAKIFYCSFDYVTPPRTHRISGLKSHVLKPTFLAINDGEKWSRIFYFEILLARSELLLPSAKKSAQKGRRLNWPGRLAGISKGAW